MAVRPPFDIQRVGVGKLRRIAISGADAKMNIVAGLDSHAANARFFSDPSIAELVGAFKAKKLFNYGIDQSWVLLQAGQLAGCSNNAATPLPIKLVVDSWPAFKIEMQF